MLGPEVLTVTVGVALLTTWTRTLEVSVLNFAVMLCEPTSSADVVSVAVLPEITPVPMLVAPSLNVTEPLFPDGRVAVKVTDCVKFEGFGEELSRILDTEAATVFEVLGL